MSQRWKAGSVCGRQAGGSVRPSRCADPTTGGGEVDQKTAVSGPAGDRDEAVFCARSLALVRGHWVTRAGEFLEAPAWRSQALRSLS